MYNLTLEFICKRLNFYGSVLFDVSLFSATINKILMVKAYAGQVVNTVKLAGQATGAEKFEATKGTYMTCLNTELAKTQYKVNGKQLTTTDPHVKAVLDLLPDEGRLRRDSGSAKKDSFLTPEDLTLLMNEVRLHYGSHVKRVDGIRTNVNEWLSELHLS